MESKVRKIQIGLETCVADRPAVLDGSRFGLLMNRASVDREFRLACDVLAESYSGQLAALFTPQHGLWGDRQANMVETPHSHHTGLDIPIFSLYSETRRPTREMLSGLDCLVVDLQDVGTRVYTYVWTVLNCLEECAETGIPVLVLDRPNPIGGEIVEGPLLESDQRSFVGGACIPMRHGLTIGELTVMLNEEMGIGAQVQVAAIQGWSRSQMHPSLNRHWIPPSPNLPRFQSAMVYPGQVLLEGTNLSEGRGTTSPFEVFGAPFIEPIVLCDELSNLELPGVRFLPIRFTPTFDKWAGKSCGGLSLHVTDAKEFRPYRTTVAILGIICHKWPHDFAWLDPPYEYETIKPPIDIISGSSALREQFSCAHSPQTLDFDPLIAIDERAWFDRVAPYLLY